MRFHVWDVCARAGCVDDRGWTSGGGGERRRRDLRAGMPASLFSILEICSKHYKKKIYTRSLPLSSGGPTWSFHRICAKHHRHNKTTDSMDRVRPRHEESALLSFLPPLDRGLLFLLADRGRIRYGGLIASQPATGAHAKVRHGRRCRSCGGGDGGGGWGEGRTQAPNAPWQPPLLPQPQRPVPRWAAARPSSRQAAEARGRSSPL
eukprot:scaffold49548_cov62-Phaeocystis_antarctica.AAC.4